MSQRFVLYCDGCGLPISGAPPGDYCPRCGYPINRDKEEQFLNSSIRDLQRVAAYGGANMTITNLIQRYQGRLRFLYQTKMAPVQIAQEPSQVEPLQSVTPQASSERVVSPALPSVTRPAEIVLFPSQPVVPAVTPINVAPVVTPTNVAPVQSRQPVPGRMFSLKSFFADQTITIVASLGAFLILLGSLSFVATTKDLLLSFLVVFIVHAVFGVTGMVSYRFQSFRTVAAIYTAIFALLVPLVGFSCYRLVVGNLIQLAPPTLVAIAAAYAAIVYGFLAVYQKFSPFGYLSVAALAIADLAVASAFNLHYWWWPVALMLLALPALVSVMPANTTPLRGIWAIGREPVRALMFTSVTICGLGIIFTFFHSLSLDALRSSMPEVRFSVVSMTLLLFCWTCLFTWYTQQSRFAFAVPYLFLASVLALSYAFAFNQSGYALALTAVALLYHGLNRFASRLLQPFDKIERHMEILALVLVGLVPLIFGLRQPQIRETVLETTTILAGVALTISIMLHHTSLQRIPDASQTRWRWLILYSGFLFTWAYSVVVLSLNAEPVWCFLGITLVLVVGTVALRHFFSSSWANPLDVLVLGEVMLTLLLSLNQDLDHIIALLLCFATISYGVLLFQRRPNWLFLPLVFVVLALPALSKRPPVCTCAQSITTVTVSCHPSFHHGQSEHRTGRCLSTATTGDNMGMASAGNWIVMRGNGFGNRRISANKRHARLVPHNVSGGSGDGGALPDLVCRSGSGTCQVVAFCGGRLRHSGSTLTWQLLGSGMADTDSCRTCLWRKPSG